MASASPQAAPAERAHDGGSPPVPAGLPTTGGAASTGGHSPSRRDPGEVVRIGARRGYTDDLYHYLLKAPWSRVMLLVGATYLGINLLFAGLYLAGGDCLTGVQPGSFADA